MEIRQGTVFSNRKNITALKNTELTFHSKQYMDTFEKRFANSLLTNSLHRHRIPPNMFNKLGFGTMTMTTTSGNNREAFVFGQR